MPVLLWWEERGVYTRSVWKVPGLGVQWAMGERGIGGLCYHLTSNMMSWEYITVILAFCNHWILFHMLLFTPPLMRKVCAKMAPRLLNDDQKKCHMQVCQDIIKHLQTEPELLRSHHWWWDMDFWVWPRNQAPELSVKVSNIAEAEESKTVKIKSQSHVDHVLWCQRHIIHSEFLPQGQTINQRVYKDPAAFASLSAREEMRVVAGQIVAASPQQCTCSQRPAHSSWPRRTLPYGNNLPIHLILLRVTFFFSPSSRGSPHFEGMKAIKRAVTTSQKNPSSRA